MTNKSITLGSYCKANKWKLPKDPYYLQSTSLLKIRTEILSYLRSRVDKEGGQIDITIPHRNTAGRIFSENGEYLVASDLFGKYNLEDLSTDFLGEQLYYSLAEKELWGPSQYEKIFDSMKGMFEDWLPIFVSNKEKKESFNPGLSFQNIEYYPCKSDPITISSIFFKDGVFDYDNICFGVDGKEDVFWDDLNIDARVCICDSLYLRLISAVAPASAKEALWMFVNECKNTHTRAVIAVEPGTPVEILSILSKDKKEDVRRCVAMNPSATSDMLIALLHDPESGFVQDQAARNPGLPAELLVELATRPETEVRMLIASNPGTPAGTLAKLADDSEADVREKVSGNSSAPQEVLAKLAKDSRRSIRERVAGNPATPAGVLAGLADDPERAVRDALVNNTNTPPDTRISILAVLSGGSDGDRKQVASNADTPADILAKLAEDPEERVRIEVARNPNTPAELLARLAEEPSVLIRVETAKNPNTPPDILEKLADDADFYVRKGVAENPGLPADLIVKLVKNGVVGTYIKSPNTPVDILVKLAGSPNWMNRCETARNPCLPADILTRLALEQVCKDAVLENPGLPLSVALKSAVLACYYPKEFSRMPYTLFRCLSEYVASDPDTPTDR